jgi:hypothetical protein
MSTEARLDRLERQNQWMRRSVALLVAAGAFILLSAQGKEQLLADPEVRSLTVKDDSGRPRVVLGMKQGAACLSLRDAAGKERLELTSEKNSGLSLCDADGTLRAYLTLNIHGDPALVMFDSKGIHSVILQSLAGSRPLLRMLDGDKSVRVAVGILDDSPTFTLRDADGKITWGSPR